MPRFETDSLLFYKLGVRGKGRIISVTLSGDRLALRVTLHGWQQQDSRPATLSSAMGHEPQGLNTERRTDRRGKMFKTWRLTSTETIRLIRDGEKGEGVWRWGPEEGDYIPIATLSPPE